MIDETMLFKPFDATSVEVILCDADGVLFDSEPSAFVASTAVTNRLLAALGIDRRFTPVELRRRSIGRNFRSTAQALVTEAGLAIEAETLERWVVHERDAVVAQLSAALRPDPAVRHPLAVLAARMRLAVVTSSSMTRLDACLSAAELVDLFSPAARFSAEDSLPVPTSKPDPAIYRLAGRQMGVTGETALAVEDAVPGAESAVGAGFPTVGNLQFVPPEEQRERIDELREVGVTAIVPSWRHLAHLLACGTAPAPLQPALHAFPGGLRSGVPSTG